MPRILRYLVGSMRREILMQRVLLYVESLSFEQSSLINRDEKLMKRYFLPDFCI